MREVPHHEDHESGILLGKHPKRCKRIRKKMIQCQLHAPIPNNPPKELRSIISHWPFAQWGVDLVGPMPPSKGGTKFIIVIIDYFTK